MQIFKKIDLKNSSTLFIQSCSALFLLQTVRLAMNPLFKNFFKKSLSLLIISNLISYHKQYFLRTPLCICTKATTPGQQNGVENLHISPDNSS